MTLTAIIYNGGAQQQETLTTTAANAAAPRGHTPDKSVLRELFLQRHVRMVLLVLASI